WAAQAWSTYGRDETLKIAEAIAKAGFSQARHYAKWAVEETGFGLAEHKRIKNEAYSQGIYDRYKSENLTGIRENPREKVVEIARPAGVIFALTPSTNPISTLYYKVMISALTRNAIVISPHPMAKACSADAARHLAQAAEDAGAPDGVIQVIPEPSIPII